MPLTEIQREIGYGIENLERVYRHIQLFNRLETTQDIKTSALTYESVGYYNALEHLIIRILKHLDQKIPSGEFSHRETLKVFQTILEKFNFEPPKLIPVIETLMAFRHVATKIYGFLIDWNKLQSILALVELNHHALVALFQDLAREIVANSNGE